MKTQEWRQFEQLVALIEKTARRHEAVVTSPDRIRDSVAGIMREVDASIKFKSGGKDILITVECRKRNRSQDITWIEQLATKLKNIGADKTIAVSSEGFSISANKAAMKLGIETRRLSEISIEEIEDWFLPRGVVHLCRLVENIKCFIVPYDKNGEPSKCGLILSDVDLPAFYQNEIMSPFPISVYLSILESTLPELFANVPLDGTKVELEFPIKWGKNDLVVDTNDGMKSVYLTRLTATVSYQSTVCELRDGVHHEYAGQDGTKIQQSSFDTQWLDGAVQFHHQSSVEGEHRVAVEFKDIKNKEGR